MEKNPKGIILKRWIIENAADYYLSSQDFSQALFYLQKLGFYSKIIDISYNRFFDIVETAKTLEIEPLIERLPEEIRNNYVIRLFRAHIYLLTHNFNGTITEAEKVPEKELPPDLCAFLNYLKGSAYYYLSDYEKAEEFAKRGFECGKVLEEKVLYKLYNLIGAINSMNENLEEAEKAYNKAKEIAEKIIVSRKGFVLLWANIGNIHYKKGEYWKAESLYKKALELADTPDIRAYILGWLVLTYSSRGEIEKTLDTLKELYKEAKNSGRDYYLISYYSALSDYEIFRGNFEKAMFYNKKFREIYEKYKDPEILFNVKLFNSVYELITGNPERALEIAKSLEAKRETLIIEKYNLLGKIYTKLGDFEKAEEYFKKVYNSDIKNVYTKRVSLIPYFLFLFCKREYQRAKDIFREISKIPDKKALLFSLEYNLKIFPCKIDYKEVINFIRSI
jgi:tetratricopeptide (TPR) repeat protein